MLQETNNDGEMSARDLNAIENPKLKKLFDYWLLLKGDKKLPLRNDVNPIDLAFMLGWILLIEIHPDPNSKENFRFRYRLSGAELDKISRCSLQGHWAHELNDNFQRQATIKAFQEAASTGKPNFYYVVLKKRGAKYLTYERVTLPLATSEPNQPGMLLVGIQGVTEPASKQYYADLPAMQETKEKLTTQQNNQK